MILINLKAYDNKDLFSLSNAYFGNKLTSRIDGLTLGSNFFSKWQPNRKMFIIG